METVPAKENSASGAQADELYVGYLPTPPAHRRFLRRLVPPLGLGFVAAGLLLAWSFGSPGDAVWDTQAAREFEGVLMTDPYAMIRVTNAGAHQSETLVLVAEGKHGAAELVAGLDGRRARVRGHILERDGRRLLELTAPPTPLALQTPAPSGPDVRADLPVAPPTAEPLGSVTLRGEIIDPKCYFGAMKPGEGKTHKECATLCIAGGIPPMFLVRGANGERVYYLLTDADGAAANTIVLPYLADPVEITGALERRGDLVFLKIDADGIRRL